MGVYTFQLEKFHIDNTRALHNDTDTVTFGLKIGNQQFSPLFKGMGDVNNGDHSVGLEFSPVIINPSTEVVLSYIIVNSGFPGSHEGDLHTVLDTLSDASEKVANAVYPLGPVWPIVNKIVHSLNILIVADCDGPVAGDRIPGPTSTDQIPANTLTGAHLDTLISGAGGTFRLTRFYPGTDSATGCGSNSKYNVTWSVNSLPAQDNWKWCNKCQVLAYGDPGPCAAGGTHDHTNSWNYTLVHDSPIAFSSGTLGQNNWKWCNKCQALAFGDSGPCPAGGTHDHTNSWNYTLVHDSPNVLGQDNWRWCNKCQVLAYGDPGPCAAGGIHDHTGSGNYILSHTEIG